MTSNIEIFFDRGTFEPNAPTYSYRFSTLYIGATCPLYRLCRLSLRISWAQ
jgi:hypothetical protein